MSMRVDTSIELFEELLSMVEPLIQIDTKYEKNIVGLVVSCRFQIPLHGPTDFVCNPTRPTDKIRTNRTVTNIRCPRVQLQYVLYVRRKFANFNELYNLDLLCVL